MRFLLQLPGLWLVNALILLSAIGDSARFPSPQQLVGYSGLGASVHASGKTQRTGKVTKQGRRELRTARGAAAWVAVERPPLERSGCSVVRAEWEGQSDGCDPT